MEQRRASPSAKGEGGARIRTMEGTGEARDPNKKQRTSAGVLRGGSGGAAESGGDGRGAGGSAAS